MRFEHMYDHYFFMPEQTEVINRLFQVGDSNYLLAAVTKQADTTSVWLLYECEIEEDKFPRSIEDMPKTKREEMEGAEYNNFNKTYLTAKEFNFGGKVFRVCRSSGGRLNYHQVHDYTKVQHFLDRGLSMAMLRELDDKKLGLAVYELQDQETFEIDDLDHDSDIVVTTDMTFKRYAAQHKMILNMGLYEEAIEVELEDPTSKERIKCQIHGLDTYDFWAENDFEGLANAKQQLPKEAQVEWEKNVLSTYETLCPRDKVLAFVHYEVKDGVSLEFYSTELLDKKIERQSGAAGVGVIIGRNGKGKDNQDLRSAMIMAVDRDFDGPIEVELLRWSQQIPGFTIQI